MMLMTRCTSCLRAGLQSHSRQSAFPIHSLRSANRQFGSFSSITHRTLPSLKSLYLNLAWRWARPLRMLVTQRMTVGMWRTVVVSGRGLSIGVSLSLVPLCISKAQCGNKTSRTDSLRRDLAKQKEVSLHWRHVWSLIRPHVLWLIAAVVTALCTAFINIQIPLLLGELINAIADVIKDGSDQVDMQRLITPIFSQVVKLTGYYVVQALLTATYISCLSVLGERIASELRIRLFNSLLSQQMSFFDSQRVGELVARLNNDVHEFKSSFKQCISQGLRTVTQIGGSVVCLFVISPSMTVITVSTLPVIILCGTAFGAGLRAWSRLAQQQAALTSAVAQEAFGNIRTVRSFAMEDEEMKLYEREVRKMERQNIQLGFGIAVFQGASNFVLNGVVISVLYGGSRLIIANQLNPGDLMSFLVTAQTIQRSMAQLSVLFGQAVRGYTAGARVFQFIDQVPELPLTGGKRIPHHALLGNIKFDNVKFTYSTRPQHPVFDGLTLKVPAGKSIALVGESGAGKSTITSLLMRFYDVNEGSITCDGVDVKHLDPQWWRGSAIGIISQEPVLFGTTIRENIRYGLPDATNEQIEEAAKLANAHRFIESFPDGYETIVGERGVTLSGGQKQRVAIARALLKDPPILILDEATSALDAESEKLVHAALEQACKNRTVLIIAHRLSTIQNADSIAVLRQGNVIETGTHAQLMKKRAAYYNLVSSQTTDTIGE